MLSTLHMSLIVYVESLVAIQYFTTSLCQKFRIIQKCQLCLVNIIIIIIIFLRFVSVMVVPIRICQ